jgi:hypothetical protein
MTPKEKQHGKQERVNYRKSLQILIDQKSVEAT